MKIVLSENQYKRLIESEENRKVLRIPSLNIFDNDWDTLQKFLVLKGNPPYSVGSDLDLRNTKVKSLGNLVRVDGDMNLETPIESLGNLQSVGGDLYMGGSMINSLGNLKFVDGDLSLQGSEIQSLGNLTTVGGEINLIGTKINSLGVLEFVGKNLYLQQTPLSKMYSEKQIRKMVSVSGGIYLSNLYA